MGMKRLMIGFIAVTGLFTAGCREQVDGAYVSLTGKLFVFNYRIAEATYLVTLVKLQPTPDGARVTGIFDDPAGDNRIIVEQKIWVNNDKIILESPALNCVVKDKPYRFDVEISGPNGVVLQKLSGVITSSLDQDILPDHPLVVGPAYTPNPVLEGHPDGKIPGLMKAPCPQR
jgi:hypothetical protein